MSFVQIDHPHPKVTLVTLNRPERMNAMAFEVMIPLRDALREISYLLPRQVGFSRAFDILLTGRDVDAAEAERIGLVSQVVPGRALLDRCYELADGIIGFSQIGVEITKQLLWASYDAGALQAHMNHEGHAQLYVRMTTGNFEEKIAAWKEGRTPVYTDD